MELVAIGYFSKTQGVKGQLLLRLSKDIDTDKVTALFVESSGSKAPYFVKEIRDLNNGTMVSLEEIDTVEKARLFIGKEVFADGQFVFEDESEDAWIGFELIDKQHGSLGLIQSVTDNGSQTLVSLSHKDREVILPLVDEFIEKVDESNRKIYFNAPEGLIDIYLGEDGAA